MDDNLVDEILKEDLPEWNDDDFKEIDDVGIFDQSNDELSSICTEIIENDSHSDSHLNSTYGTMPSSTVCDKISVSSSGLGFIGSARNSGDAKINSNQRNESGIYSETDSGMKKECSRIIKYSILSKVANQLMSNKSRMNMGQACCCARGKYLAVGTSRGMAALFDLKQILRYLIGSQERGSKYGSVSCLSFNINSTRLLMGYVKCHIDMWDISQDNCHLLRSIDVNQGPGYAVSFVRFLSDPTLAVYVDTNGSVFQLSFKRGITGRTTDCECFFSGSRGEILCVEPLYISPSRTYSSQTTSRSRSQTHSQPQSHKAISNINSIDDYTLLAMASFTKLVIVSSKPILKVQYMSPLKGDPHTLPQLVWSINPIQLYPCMSRNEDNILLTFGRQSTINILYITNSNNSNTSNNNNNSTTIRDYNLNFKLVATIKVDYDILSLKWLNCYLLGIIDLEENLHVYDVVTQSDIEIINLNMVKLIYNTSLFKSIATGGQVSEAMKMISEHVVYHSVAERSGQIKLLGDKYLHMFMLRNWEETIDFTLSTRGLVNTFQLCNELYKGPEQSIVARSVVQLPQDDFERYTIICSRVVKLINDNISTLYDDTDTDLVAVFDSLLNLCFTIDKISYYTDDVFTIISNITTMKKSNTSASSTSSSLPHIHQVYIQTLLPFILSNKIHHLHPELVHNIIDFLLSIHHIVELDKVITKLQISCLDIDYIIRIATSNKLFASLIHIYNSALQDYLTPLQLMVDFIDSADYNTFHPDIQSETIINAILYLHCCLAGTNYFNGHPIESPEIRYQIQLNIFDYLIPFNKIGNMKPLRLLLQHNTNDFLNMLTLAFDEPFFTDSQLGLSRKQVILSKICDHFTIPQSIPSPASSTTSTTAISLNKDNQCNDKESQMVSVIQFIIFLSREITKPSSMIYMDNDVLDQLIEQSCLCAEYVNSQTHNDHHNSSDTHNRHIDHYHNCSLLHRQMESAILNCLQCLRLKINMEKLLKLSRRANLLRICEYIYRQKGMLHMVLESYLLDQEYKCETYKFIDSIWHDKTLLTEPQRGDVVRKCFELAELLVLTNSDLAVVVLLTVCNKRLDEIIDQLAKKKYWSRSKMLSEPPVLLFLKSFFLIRQEIVNLSSTSTSLNLAPIVCVDLKSIPVSKNISHLFIELMCEYCNNNTNKMEEEEENNRCLMDYLRHSVDYNSEDVIDIISKYRGRNNTDINTYVLGFVLEKLKRYKNAGTLYVEQFDRNWSRWIQETERINNPSPIEFTKCIQHFGNLVVKSNNAKNQTFWCLMLDSILIKFTTHKSQIHNTKIKEIMTYFIKCMSSNPNLSVAMILSAVLKNPIFHNENYGEVKELFLTLVKSYFHETSLLNAGLESLGRSINCGVKCTSSLAVEGSIVRDRASTCNVCGLVMGMSDGVCVYRCGHWSHVGCVDMIACNRCIQQSGISSNTSSSLSLPCNTITFSSQNSESGCSTTKTHFPTLFPDIQHTTSTTTNMSMVQLSLTPPNYLDNYTSK